MVNDVLLSQAVENLDRRDMDVISDLPDCLLETILMKMSLRDAARTCILSRRWRYIWVKLPSLKLDAPFWQQALQNKRKDRAAKFESILFRILLVHQGQLINIHLHIPELEYPPHIDTLITFIARNGVQVCCLDTVRGRHFKLHSSLFTCPTLNYLDLRFCEVNFLPSAFERFSNLGALTLADVAISDEALKSLVSACPYLLILVLRVSIDIECLEIIAPKLVDFVYFYSGSSQSPLAVNYGQRQPAIFTLLSGFPHLRNLYLDRHCLKSLAAGGLPRSLPTFMLHRLKSLELYKICLEDVNQFSSVLCRLRSFPNLQTLKVRTTNNNKNVDNHEEEEDYSNLTLRNLVEVKIIPLVVGRLESKFIKILLGKSPSLRKINIVLDTSKIADKGLKIIEGMFTFQRVSPNVEIHIEDN